MSQAQTLQQHPFPHHQGFVRKRYPLISFTLPIHFQTSTGDFVLETAEISHEEFRVTCPAADIPKLVPRTAHHRPDQKILHQAKLYLDDEVQLDLELEVSLCRRFSQNEFKIGFRLKQASDEDHRKLQALLDEALQKNARPVSILN